MSPNRKTVNSDIPAHHHLRKHNNNNNNNNGSSTTGAKVAAVPLYHPSVFRYSCRGRLQLDSRVPTAGVCQGVQTQLKAVEHLRLGTKEEALNYFQQKSALGEAGPGAGTGGAATATTGTGSAAAGALQSAYLSNVLVYNTPIVPSAASSPPNGEDGDSDKNKKRSSADNEEEALEKWSCVGSTEVDLLVLRPQNSKEEHIAAISPYCAPGMTTRDVTTPALGRDRTSTIRLGFFEIVYVSSMAPDDDVLEDEEEQRQQREEEISKKFPSKHQNVTSTNHSDNPKIPTSRQQQQQQQQSQDNKQQERRQRRNSSNHDSSKKQTQALPIRIYNSSVNILQHMKINAQLIYEATQDDFPNRTVAASKRIVNEFDTTLNRTLGLMKRVANWDWDFGGGDDDDDNNGGRGGPRR